MGATLKLPLGDWENLNEAGSSIRSVNNKAFVKRDEFIMFASGMLIHLV